MSAAGCPGACGKTLLCELHGELHLHALLQQDYLLPQLHTARCQQLIGRRLCLHSWLHRGNWVTCRHILLLLPLLPLLLLLF